MLHVLIMYRKHFISDHQIIILTKSLVKQSRDRHVKSEQHKYILLAILQGRQCQERKKERKEYTLSILHNTLVSMEKQ